VLVGGLLFPSGVSALYAVLLHRGENALPEALVFAASWQLLLMLSIAALGLGIFCGRKPSKRPPTMELIGAVCATTVLPVTLLGRMEGNTGAVVIVSGLTVVVALLARRLGAKLRRGNAQVQPS
jgi:hypothetical protein